MIGLQPKIFQAVLDVIFLDADVAFGDVLRRVVKDHHQRHDIVGAPEIMIAECLAYRMGADIIIAAFITRSFQD